MQGATATTAMTHIVIAEARRANQAVANLLRTIAKRKKATPVQIGLAWIPMKDEKPNRFSAQHG